MVAKRSLFFATALLAGFLTACHAQEPPTHGANMKLHLTSTAFADGQPIPRRHTSDDQDLSPALQWSGAPPATKSLALICDDPDAPMGTWVHWVIYDLPPGAAGLSEGAPKSPELAGGAKQGVNDFKRIGYGGPAPPPGKAHRYFFKLYALDTKPGLKPGLTKQDLLQAMDGHVLAEGQLVGTYQRK
ncbi:MAG: YbhB/YbcL family Raf kinase inhibitor-like protein [Verrucomicrobiota bacterium]|jgi:Raf kinase inhibitor-like YbhB/YbcL family protein